MTQLLHQFLGLNAQVVRNPLHVLGDCLLGFGWIDLPKFLFGLSLLD